MTRSARQFPPYHDTPIWIDVEGGGPKTAAAVAAQVRKVEGVAEVGPPQRLAPGVTAVQVVSANPFASEASQTTVNAIRDLPPPAGADSPGRRRDRRLRRLPVEPRPRTCRSRSGS